MENTLQSNFHFPLLHMELGKDTNSSVPLISKGTCKKIPRFVMTLNCLSPFSFLSNSVEERCLSPLKAASLLPGMNSFPILWFVSIVDGDSQSHSCPFTQRASLYFNSQLRSLSCEHALMSEHKHRHFLFISSNNCFITETIWFPVLGVSLVSTVLVCSLSISSLAADRHILASP